MPRGGPQFKISPELAHYLAYYRFIHKLEIRQMAKLIGLSHATYHELEKYKRPHVGQNTAEKVKDFFVGRYTITRRRKYQL